MVLNIIKSTINTKGLEELKIANQFSGQYLGSATEYALIEILAKAPHLVKLGVRMEFRDSLNKCALQLAKNLDRSKLKGFGGFFDPHLMFNHRASDRRPNIFFEAGQDRKDWTTYCFRQEIRLETSVSKYMLLLIPIQKYFSSQFPHFETYFNLCNDMWVNSLQSRL